MEVNLIPIAYLLGRCCAVYDTGASISVRSKHFNDRLQNKPKLARCSRNISNASGEALIPIGECFVQIHTGRKYLGIELL